MRPGPTLPPKPDLRGVQREILEAIAVGLRLSAVADLLCRRIEVLAPLVSCSILAVDLEGRLRPIAAPGLPASFAPIVDGLRIGPDIGTCGRAAYYGRPVESIDIGSDPNWAHFRAIPCEAGLRACWSNPVRAADGRVIGAFALYFRTCRRPSRTERRIVRTSVHLCALAMQHEALLTRIEQTNRQLDAVLGNVCQGLCFFDGDRRLILANRRYTEIYDIPEDRVLPGMSLRQIVDLRVAVGSGPAMTNKAYLEWRDGVQVSSHPTDTVVELANGKSISIHHRPMPDGGWVATHEDVTERLHAERRITYLARHDALTGLPNRLLFRERLGQAIDLVRRGQNCAILGVDLDRFKEVNDSFGHPIGDQLLVAAAKRLQGCVRPGDTVTRLGGDEFAVLLADLDGAKRAAEAAQRILLAISQSYEIGGHRLSIGCSIGIAVTPDDGDGPEMLLRHADVALYRAKADERGTYCFFKPDMAAEQQARLAMESDLRRALLGNEFELHYQPLLNLERNAASGFEALLRWHHPRSGLIQPTEFIHVAEESGVIVQLGEWTLKQACADAAAWPEPVRVAVNLSAVQFKSRTLTESVENALAASGLDASRLELEVTESVLLNRTADTLETLHRLRERGVKISMDDFGTGYSSLSYLQMFPFEKIKIDKSFIRDVVDRHDSLAIVRAVAGLGRSLGMTTTAEGIEKPEQLAIVRAEGFTEAQGYLFSPPRPASYVPEMLRSAGRVHR